MQIVPFADGDAVRALRARLDAFYANTTDYPAFCALPDQSGLCTGLRPILGSFLAVKSTVRVLEVGAGRPTFHEHFADLRDRLIYDVQDVTAQNVAYLRTVADHVWIGDVSAIHGSYDIIFSAFVFEHVTDPPVFLSTIDRLLAPGGAHVMVCPRYDVPGYVPPSLRHLDRFRRIANCFLLWGYRLATSIDRTPRFLINLSPAVFHVPWYVDADATHLVSRSDVELWHRSHNYRVHRLRLHLTGWRQRLFWPAILLMDRFDKC